MQVFGGLGRKEERVNSPPPAAPLRRPSYLSTPAILSGGDQMDCMLGCCTVADICAAAAACASGVGVPAPMYGPPAAAVVIAAR